PGSRRHDRRGRHAGRRGDRRPLRAAGPADGSGSVRGRGGGPVTRRRSHDENPDRRPVYGGETHRGGFGEFGGESGAFIERTFRERIILVGVSFPPYDDEAVEASLDELALLVDTAGADVV